MRLRPQSLSPQWGLQMLRAPPPTDLFDTLGPTGGRGYGGEGGLPAWPEDPYVRRRNWEAGAGMQVNHSFPQGPLPAGS